MIPALVIVRAGSHRARHKLDRLCPGSPDYYVWRNGGATHYQVIPADQLSAALSITGVTAGRLKAGERLCPCW